MATFSLSREDVFPNGTSVGAYPKTNWLTSQLPPSGAAQGAATSTGTVTSGSVTFTGLSDNTRYYAAASVSGTWQYIGFSTPPASSTGGGVPSGGTVGQYLKKNSSTDGDASWAALVSGVLLPSAVYVPAVWSKNTATALTLNREHCIGFDLAPQTIERFAFRLAVAGSVGAVIRIGIRADSGSLTPGAPAYQETVDVTGATGWKQTTAMSYVHPGGILWFTWTGQGWSTTAPSVDGNSDRMAGWVRPMATNTTFVNLQAAADPEPSLVGTMDSVTGTLPATFTPTPLGGVSQTMRLFIRRA